MKEIVPSDSKYVPLTQQRWCCVPTCIQMVMLRYNIPLIPAELLGYHMGLIVPADQNDLFWNMRTGEKPRSGYGTQAGNPTFSPNAVFKKLGIPLKMTWSLINKFKTFKDYQSYIMQIENSGKDVLVCFDWGTLFDEPEFRNGHVCVLDKVINDYEVRIIDPSEDAPKWKIVKTEKLYKAMQIHGNNKSGGFWEIYYIED